MPGKISNTGWSVIAGLLLTVGVSTDALASANATISVNGSEQQISGAWDQGSITVAFNGFSETVQYAQFSSSASVASALAAMFSRDYIKYGLCANASGATINFHLKGTATFGPVAISGPASSFHLSPTGFASQVSSADTGTVTLTVNGVVAATARYSEGSTPTSVAAGLQAGETSSSPVTITAVNDQIYLQAKTPGASSNYTYTLQGASSNGFNPASFYGTAYTDNLEGGADQNASGSTVYSYSESYYPNGNVQTTTDSVIGAWNYQNPGYDNLNRLVNGSATSGTYSGQNVCWTYDAYGNRLSEAITTTACSSSPTPTQWAHYNSSNQVTATNQATGGLGYDAAGDITNDGVNQYLYDGEGRLCAVLAPPPISGGPSLMIGYIYNAEGQRVAKGVITTWSCDPATNGFTAQKDFIIGPSGEQLTEMGMGESGVMAWNHTNVYANGQLMATYDNNGLHFHLNDALGTRRAQTDYAGVLEETYSSLPFGDQLSGFGPGDDVTEHHFTGKERDSESGLDYFGRRHYASTMGRFMSPDDPNNDTSLSDPQSLNLYAYGRNNPLTNTDPTGEACVVHQDGSRTDDNSGGESCAEVAAEDAQHPASVTVTAKPGNALGSIALNSAMALSNMAGDYFFGITGLRAYPNDQLANDWTGKGANIGVNVAGLVVGPEGETGEAITITEKGLAHIAARHLIGGAKTAGKSLFNAGTDVRALVKAAEGVAPTTNGVGNLERIVQAATTVGTDRATGQATSVYTVVTKPNGELVTAFPGRP